jgi:hypothetical protein
MTMRLSALGRTLMLAATLGLAGVCMAQVGQTANPPAGGGGGTVNGQPTVITIPGNGDPEQMKKMMEQWKKDADQRMKESLSASDEEWAVIQPKIEKVSKAQGDARGRMRVVAPGADQKPSDLQKALADLAKLLKDPGSKPEDIKTALAAYREARAKAKAEVDKAQNELKEILTVRQEAQLVVMQILD